MLKSRKVADYTLNVTPYLPWVHAFGRLILETYEERKSVGKTWKALKEAKPEFEQLDLASFEDMLLISLFLSEWNKLGETANAAFENASGRRADLQNKAQDELDKVIQILRNVTEERDTSLEVAVNLEENVKILASQKEDMERLIQSLESESDGLRSQLAAANEGLNQVLHELDNIREENAALNRVAAYLREKEVSRATKLESLNAELEKAGSGVITQPTDTIENGSADSPPMPDIIRDPSPGGTHVDAPAVHIEAIKKAGYQLKLGDTVEQIAPKKIGKWNAQRSKDGYYRLYRKIRGKVHSIYIGRRFDTEKAEKRIAEKERTLLSME